MAESGPRTNRRKIYADIANIFILFAGAAVLFVMLAGMFMNNVPILAVLGVLIFVLNSILVLRLPVHSWVQTLTRKRASRLAALVHLIGFFIMSLGEGSADGVIIFVFAVVPAASLFLASFAMQRLAQS